MKKICKENFVITGRFFSVMVLALALMIMAFPLGASQAKASGPPSYYPYKFDGEGQIDEFRKGVVIINDTLLKLAPGVRYYTPRSQWASQANFPKGAPVGYMLDSNKEIIGIYLITKTTE